MLVGVCIGGIPLGGIRGNFVRLWAKSIYGGGSMGVRNLLER